MLSFWFFANPSPLVIEALKEERTNLEVVSQTNRTLDCMVLEGNSMSSY